jgi:hypothetical protein
MTHTFKLARRTARLRAGALALLIVAAGACDDTDRLAPSTEAPTSTTDSQFPGADSLSGDGVAEDSTASDELGGPSLATVSYRGGIPFGHFHLPNSSFGSVYDGALRNIWPEYLLSNLSAIKARGGKVMISLAGNRKYYTDSYGRFSFTKWKSQVYRYRNINFSSYITGGTIIAHYLVDEPSCSGCWGGQVISQSTLEAMAKYSKSLWPSMPTAVRTYADWLGKWSGTYYYLDAAWAQYVYRHGDASDFLSREVSAARRKGLALVVGLNILNGGPNRSRMTATQVKSWGATLLSSSYPCAFLSWQYNSDYLSRSDIKSAMYYLRDKAKNRSFKTCRGS